MGVLPLRADETGLTFSTAAPMFAANPALEIVAWNEGAEALLAFTRSEVLGRRCFEVLDCPGPARQRCCEGRGEGVAGFDSEVATRAGERILVSVTTLLAAGGGGAPLRLHLLREARRERQLEDLLREVVAAASRLGPPAGPASANGARAALPAAGVTRREREVVRLLAQGCSTGAIAARLGILPRTARNHIQNVLCKLGAHSRLEAVARASARGLL